ncbi:MAG: hypothetical protein PUB61_04625 [Bacteroidales bacterium]|nr:hypothetical protein [Bacteroidales bacterium]
MLAACSKVDRCFVLSMNNVEVANGVTYLPLYMTSLLYPALSILFLLQGLTDNTLAQCSLFLFKGRIYYILHRHRCAHANASPFSPFVTELYE